MNGRSPTAGELAAQFSKELREWLTPEQMAKVNARNATPQYVGLCASHDFCDPNMAMLKAYSDLTGIDGNSVDPNSVIGLMSEAWGIAKHSNFEIAPGGAPENTTYQRKSRRDLLRECLSVLEELNSSARIAGRGPAGIEMTQRSRALEAELRENITLIDEDRSARERASDEACRRLSVETTVPEVRLLPLLWPPNRGTLEQEQPVLGVSAQEPSQAPPALTVPGSSAPSPTDDDLRARWRAAGGSFHGPNVETGTMPEVDLLQFLRSLSSTYRDVVTFVAAALKASHPNVNAVTDNEFGHEATRTMHALIRWEIAHTLRAVNRRFDSKAFLEACRPDPKVSGDPDQKPKETNLDCEQYEADRGDEEPNP